MRRPATSFFIVLYIVALCVLGYLALSLAGLIPGVDLSVEGLSNTQSLFITLGVMALVVVRLFLHFRARRAAAQAVTPPEQ